MGHDYCHRHECMCYRGCPDCNPNAKDDAAPALTPAEKAGVGDGMPPSEKFAAWLNDGPRLAKEAGLYVGIKVTPLKDGEDK